MGEKKKDRFPIPDIYVCSFHRVCGVVHANTPTYAAVYICTRRPAAGSIYCMHAYAVDFLSLHCIWQQQLQVEMLRLTTVTHRGRTAYRMSAASYSVTSMCCLPPCMPFCLHILHWHRLHVHYTSDLEKNRHDRYTLLWLWSIGRSMVHEPQTTRCQTRPDFIAPAEAYMHSPARAHDFMM